MDDQDFTCLPWILSLLTIDFAPADQAELEGASVVEGVPP